MSTTIAIVILWLVVLILVSLAAYVYLDAPEYGMNKYKWAIYTLFVPFFGFVAYIFERGERDPDPDWERPEDAFVDGPFKVHKSRADDAPWATGNGEEDEKANEAKNGE